jgi:uncharacterized protein YjbI with pentapeptide repeats
VNTWLDVTVVVGAGLVLGALYLTIYFYLADKAAARSGITDPDKRATFKDSYTKTLAQMIGGAAVLATFAWTFIKDSQTLQQTSMQNANQQFIDAVKLMGERDGDKDATDANVAGIYSLRKLVETQPDYYALVRNTLMSFIDRRQSNATYPNGGRPPRVSDAVRAATYVLGILPRNGEALSFVDYYISGSDFSAAKSLSNADFRNTKLYGANFAGANIAGANFNGAAMADWVSYGWADRAFENRLALVRSGKEPQVTQLLWEDERFRYIVNFDNANLTGARFDDTSVDGASFRGATLNDATFMKTDTSRADFNGATGLESAHFDGACYQDDLEKPLNLPTTILAKLIHPCP